VSGRSGTATCAQGANPSPIKRGRRLPYCLLLIALLLGAVIVKKNVGQAFPAAQARSKAQWAQLYAALPLSFEANHGQTDPSVSFISRGKGYALFLTGGEAVLTLRKSSVASAPSSVADPRMPKSGPRAEDAVLRMQLLGANPSVKVTGTDELPGKTNYFIGNDPNKWQTNVPTYSKVRYQGVYPGVDLVYYGNRGGELEYDFVVAPGADANAIALGIGTAAHSPLKVNSGGNLVVTLDNGNVEFHKPVVYQTEANRATSHEKRQNIDARFTLDAQNHVHFELGPYDHSQPLVIDPVLTYATYVGGSGGDIGYGIAVDAFFDAYITGVTNSTNFPSVGSPYQASSKGNGDAFVAELNPLGTNLVFSSYLGGSGSDTATAIALYNGSAYVTGYTTSADFPTKAPAGSGTTNPFQLNYGGNTDAFVTALNINGTALVYSSYLGGTGADFGQGIAVDTAGNAYITGTTQSTDFPILNAYQSINNGGQDAFLTKVNFTGEQLLFSTYLGGSQADVGQAVTLDTNNDVYLTGYTFSSNFPLASPIQSNLAGGADAFVTEFNPSGTALTFSTYLGGSGDDRAYGIALDSTLNVYITGATSSGNFPVTGGVFQPNLRGASNAFVSKLSHGGTSVVYSTFLGGTGTDQANAIAVTPAGLAFVTGFTNSSDFPTQSPIQAILGLSNNNLCGSAPCSDAFVTQLNASGSALTYSTFLGGNGPDFGQGIAVDSQKNPYVTGSTSSTNFPAIYGGSYKSSLTGTAGNAFIAKIATPTPDNQPNLAILPSSLNFGNETITVTSPLQQILFVNPSTSPLTITTVAVGLVGLSSTVFQETDNCIGTIPGGGAYCTMNVSFTPSALGNQTDTITVYDNANGITGSYQTINLTGTGVTAATAVTVQPNSLSFASQAVGTVSPAQNATVTNTGTEPLNITRISTGSTGDFAETDNCLSAPYNGVLGVSQSCNVSVTFTPTASGVRAADLQISDNATGSPQSVSLTGTGAAAFTLSNPSANNPALIGSTQTTFVIQANSSSSFAGAITLTCSAGSTCAFQQNPIFAGQNTTMTISNLNPNPTSNPYPFTVTGTSGSQSTSLPLSLEFSDFNLTAAPSSVNVASGSAATYNINVNPLFGLNGQKVSLIISTISPKLSDYTYSFSNANPTVNSAGATQVQLVINTTKYIAPVAPGAYALPRFPGGKLPPALFGLLSLAGLVWLAIGHKRRARNGGYTSRWMVVRLATLSLILALNLAMAACRPNILSITGTATGSYVVTVQGTLTSNTSVYRDVVLDLSVTQGQP